MPRAERLAAALVVGVLVGLLVWVGGVAQRQAIDLAWHEDQVRILTALTATLKAERDEARNRPPRVEVRTIEKVIRPDCGHALPVLVTRSCWGH
jgi:hypothetical protein